MRRLVPSFILHNYTQGELSGRMVAAALFVDLVGFSTITDTLMQHGQHGAEVLATTMRGVFDPLVEAVYQRGGFISGFAGDAFTAIFPVDEGPATTALQTIGAALGIQKNMLAAASHQTPYGKFEISARVGAALGEVAWGIVVSEDDSRASFYFQGDNIDEAIEAQQLAQPDQIVLSAALYEAAAGLFQPAGDDVKAELISETGFGSSYYHLDVEGIEIPLPSSGSVFLELYTPPAERSAHFFPPELEQRAISGEFRQVVNVFVSIPTVLSRGQLEMFMKRVFTMQDRYGGLLNRLEFGDKGANLILFWGAPVAYENDIARALNFILDLQSLTDFPITSGITYRIAHAGYIGGSRRGEYTAYGRGVNLAARLMQAAPKGAIWVDENVAHQAELGFEVEVVGDLPFKGFARKQLVQVLTGRKRETETFYKGKLVGRYAELSGLAEFIQPLWKGEYAGVLVVWGEPGIGKSRLVYDFRATEVFDPNEILWAVCQTDEILRESLNPFRYWLRSYFNQAEQQSAAQNKRNFNRKLDSLIASTSDKALARELDRTRSFLGALVNLYWTNSLYEELDAQGRYENTFIGLTSLFSAESDRQPVIVVLEDTHWLDEDTRTFLPQLSQTLAAGKSYPLAVIATARPIDNEAMLGNGLGYQEIDLGQLTDHELAGLAEEQLGAPVSAGLLDLLTDRAEGNPFFAEQILYYLQEEDLLSNTNGAWDLVSARGESPLPADVRAVLVARLDRLAQGVKEVVQTASILGREFEVRLLASMLHDERTTPDMIDRAERAAVWSAINELRYLFKHGLLRDAAYRMQVRARRKSLHKLAYEGLENLHASDLKVHYGELAYHAERAEVPDKARTYLKLAGDAASEAYSNNQAVDYYRRALVLTIDLTEQVQIMLKLSEVLQVVGQWSEAGEFYKQALALSEDLNHRQLHARCQAAMGELLRKQGRFDEAAKCLDEARITFEEVGDPEGVGQLLHYSGTLAVQRGDYETAEARYHESLAIRRELEDQKHAAALLNNLGIISRRQGDYESAKALYEESLAFAHRAGEKRSMGIFTNNLGNLALERGDFSEARLQLEAAVNLQREVGDRWQLANALNNLGNVARAQGDYDLAINLYKESLAINRALDDREAIAYLLEDIGCLAVLEARPDLALRLIGAAETLRQAIDSPLPATDREGLDQRLEPARLALGEEAAAEAISTGRAMSMEQAMELALQKNQEWTPQES